MNILQNILTNQQIVSHAELIINVNIFNFPICLIDYILLCLFVLYKTKQKIGEI